MENIWKEKKITRNHAKLVSLGHTVGDGNYMKLMWL